MAELPVGVSQFSPEMAPDPTDPEDVLRVFGVQQDWFVKDLEDPYSTPDGKPLPGRAVCGSLVAGRWCGVVRATGSVISTSRLPATMATVRTGPSSYSDLEPYYDAVERYVGISGMPEGHAALPDGQFLPPMANDLWRAVVAKSGAVEIRSYGDDRGNSDLDQRSQSSAGVPLLRTL